MEESPVKHLLDSAVAVGSLSGDGRSPLNKR